ncbi:hypothetical protein E3N88_39403 [Mikania micrantha]|uniref:Uncharacterized protein n=1 Tax=Mikania micrantha TaxID=192012 RepID=A0A5N6LWP1_9ASTR|nr:hypothetical protein E3N88_39403 [Mikania micrantha]
MHQNYHSYYQQEPQDPNQTAESFYTMLRQVNEPLYAGSKNAKTLSTATRLLHWKSNCNISDSAFDKLLPIIKDILPNDDRLSRNFYDTKKILKPLELPSQRIHVLREHLSGPWTTYRKVPQKVVVAMFKRFKVWNTEEWRKKSTSGKDNRSKTDGSGKTSRHTGGSIGYDERRLRLRVKLGKEPTFLKLFLDTHLNKRCKKRLWAGELNVKILDRLQFCTERAKEAYVTEYLEEMTKEYGLNFTQDDARIWERLHGNSGLKRVFGIGSSDLSFVVTGTPSSSSSYGSTPSFVDQQAQQRLQDLDGRLEIERKAREELEEQMRKMNEFMKKFTPPDN